jgi:hypothetical protein
VKPYNGTKSLVISTVSWIGGKNPFLGWAYVAAAALFFLLGVLGTIRHLVKPRSVRPSACVVDCELTWARTDNSATCRSSRGIGDECPPTRLGLLFRVSFGLHYHDIYIQLNRMLLCRVVEAQALCSRYVGMPKDVGIPKRSSVLAVQPLQVLESCWKMHPLA